MSSSSPGSGGNYNYYKVDTLETSDNHGDQEQESNAGLQAYDTETDSDDDSSITLTSSSSSEYDIDEEGDEFEQFAAYKGTGKIRRSSGTRWKDNSTPQIIDFKPFKNQ